MPRSGGIQFGVCLAAATLVACSGEDMTALERARVASHAAALRDMTPAEALEDLEQIFTHFRAYYGPYEYKEARFGYAIADLEDEARAMLASAPDDDGFYTAATWFASRLDDGHVSVQRAASSNPIIGYAVGLMLQPVEGKALVAELFDPSLAGEGIAYGDEVLAVDGVSPFDLLDELLKLDAFGNPVTNQHLIFRALIRPGFAASIRPTAPTVRVDFRRADGTDYSRDLIWRERRDEPVSFVDEEEGKMPALSNDALLAHKLLELNAHAKTSLASIGSPVPFFLTPATAAAFDITPVTPNPAMLARYGLDPASLPDLYAALYSYAGKSLLLIRQPGYGIADWADLVRQLQYYRAIMDQYDAFVDGLVVDQTHNPGGSVAYVVDFARLFTQSPGSNFVQANNADRAWINDYRAAARFVDPTLSSEESLRYELGGQLIEDAYDAREGVAAPLPLYRTGELPPDDLYVWTKPMLVLIDELAGSGGDAFPMLIQRNGVAPLFGRRIMGLGGSVVQFGPLPHSDALFTVTRGLFTTYQEDGTYAPSDFIENNGVQPDIEHVISANDFRGGFLDYMTHFSDAIIGQIVARDAKPSPSAEE